MGIKRILTKLIVAVGLAALIQSTPVYASGRIQGTADQGGKRVITGLFQSSTLVQKSFVGAQVWVYNTGTTTPASIYSDSGLTTPVTNPVTADANAFYGIWIAAGDYDITIKDCLVSCGITTPWTYTAVRVTDSGGTIILGNNQNTTVGTLYKGSAVNSNRYIHNYYLTGQVNANVFMGLGAGSITPSATFPIQSVTGNGVSPIVIQTATDSGLFNQAGNVVISGVTGNTAANGTWCVKFVDFTHFSLYTNDGPPCTLTTPSVGNGAYVSGGQIGYAGFGTENVAIGYQAMGNSTSGWANVAIGMISGYSLTSGWVNTLVGQSSGSSITSGYENSFFGSNSGSNVSTGTDNTFIGADAGTNTTTASFNVCIGADSCRTNSTATGVTAVGTNSLNSSTGVLNSAFGGSAGVSITTGTDNTCIGSASCFGPSSATGLTTGVGNTFIGRLAHPASGAITLSRMSCIGYNCENNTNNSFVVGGIVGTADGEVLSIGMPTVNLGDEISSGDGNLALFKVIPANLTQDIQGMYIWSTASHSNTRYGAIVGHTYGSTDFVGLRFYVNESDGVGQHIAMDLDRFGGLHPVSYTFATLPAVTNGTMVYCSDCNSTCAAGASTGRFCFRENGAWTH